MFMFVGGGIASCDAVGGPLGAERSLTILVEFRETLVFEAADFDVVLSLRGMGDLSAL